MSRREQVSVLVPTYNEASEQQGCGSIAVCGAVAELEWSESEGIFGLCIGRHSIRFLVRPQRSPFLTKQQKAVCH